MSSPPPGPDNPAGSAAGRGSATGQQATGDFNGLRGHTNIGSARWQTASASGQQSSQPTRSTPHLQFSQNLHQIQLDPSIVSVSTSAAFQNALHAIKFVRQFELRRDYNAAMSNMFEIQQFARNTIVPQQSATNSPSQRMFQSPSNVQTFESRIIPYTIRVTFCAITVSFLRNAHFKAI